MFVNHGPTWISTSEFGEAILLRDSFAHPAAFLRMPGASVHLLGASMRLLAASVRLLEASVRLLGACVRLLRKRAGVREKVPIGKLRPGAGTSTLMTVGTVI